MTRLIDVHAPEHDISESPVLYVHAAAADVLDAVDKLAHDAFPGARALGRGRLERLFGLTWHPRPAAPGRVDIIWDLRVKPDGDGGTYLSSTRRFVASDDSARADFRSSWRPIRLSADAIARRTLRAIKHVAEEEAEVTSPSRVELLLAA
jgi:hypothetical protein